MQPCFKLALALASVLGALAWGDSPPAARVPHTSRAPKIDGKFRVEEWRAAAVLRDFPGLRAHPGGQAVGTAFYLMYDEEYLYVAAVCREPSAGYPQASPRGPLGALQDDDAIEVALGLPALGGVRTVDVGGYEGASKQALPPVAHLYEFLVNAVGATARHYNESPLPVPLFDAEVSRGKGLWVAEMRIPFRSIGLDRPVGQVLYGSFLRFRPPDRSAWHGMLVTSVYTPFPCGRLVLLEPGAATEATREAEPDVLAAPAAPAAETVRAARPGPEPRGATEPATAPVTPDWRGTKAGAEYLAERVPAPWSRPQVQGRVVVLEHCWIRLGETALPVSVQYPCGELLAGEGTIAVEYAGRDVALRFQPEPLTYQDQRIVAVSRAPLGEGAVEVKTVTEYDGFITVKIRLQGLDLRQLGRLSVALPLHPTAARFVNRGDVQNTRRLEGFGYAGPAGRTWIGCEDMGLQVDADLPLFRSQDRRRQIDVRESGSAVVLRLNLVDAPGQVEDADTVFQFYLQPTPTKRVTLRQTTQKMDLWFEQWSDYQGYPDLAKLSEVRKRADAAHAAGNLSLLYFSQMLAENAPPFAEFRDELLALPPRMWYQRAYDPGKGVPCYVCCVRGLYGDLLLDGIARLQQEGGIDGVYMDGTSVPWECSNPAHRACDPARRAGWEDDEASPIQATRAFMKRLRGLFDRSGKPFLLVAHTGGALTINTQSFVDVFWEGEQLARFLPGYRLPLHEFAVGYGDCQWGYAAMFYDRHYQQANLGKNLTRLYALLHGVDLQSDPELYAPLGPQAGAAFFPYWRGSDPVALRSTTGQSVATCYRSADRALVVVGNLGYGEDAVRVDLSRLFPDQPVEVADLFSDSPMQVGPDGRLNHEIGSYEGLELLVTPRAAGPAALGPAAAAPLPAPQPPARFAVDALPRQAWEVTGAAAEPPTLAGFGEQAVRLRSGPPGHPAAVAALQEYAWADSGTLRLRLGFSNRLSLRFGPIVISHDSGWRLDGPVDGWTTGRFCPLPVEPDKAHDLTITVRRGEVCVAMDGRPLLERVRFRLPAAGNRLELSTWAGDWLIVEGVGVCSEAPADQSAPTHPILPQTTQAFHRDQH